MRIRKRKVPLPISSLTPTPISDSDPYFTFSPVVQLVDDSDAYYDPPPSDQPIIGINHHGGSQLEGTDQILHREDQIIEEDDNTTTKKVRFMGAEETNYTLNHPHSSSTSNPDDEGFANKRKQRSLGIKDKKIKSKFSKKVEENYNIDGCSGSSKKKVRGNTLMEGSRCSRVNGRGWRCCQPTLVGYSLCEHHLGKGRLRSMNSVRSRFAMGSSAKTANELQPSADIKPELLENQTIRDDHEENDEKKKVGSIAFNNSKKKMRLGVVKARSMSSLLGQASDASLVAEKGND